MPEFIISKDRIEDAVNVIVQFLRDSGYDGSLEDGTGLNDIVIKPSAVMREMFGQMADRATAYLSLQRAYELQSDIGKEEYDAAVDCILSNWFVTRNGGRPSRGLIRLWFVKPMDFMQLNDGRSLGSIDNTPIVVDGDQVLTEQDFSYILNTTSNANEYYVDVSVRTAENSDVVITETNDSQGSITWPDIYFIRATVPQDFISGYPVESSESFIRRTEQAITTRELITARAINTVLLDTFPDITRLYVARHGSREQLRDIVYFEGARVHYGNKADIYISSDVAKQTIEASADENGFISTEQLPINVSAVDYVSAHDKDNNELSLQVMCDEEIWSSNAYLPKSLQVNATGPVKLTLLTDTVLQQVHDFVYSEEQRVACYDPMVKHAFVLKLYPILEVIYNDKKISSTSDIKNAVLEYVDYIVKNSQPWVASELVASVHVRVPNVKKILLPIKCRGEIYDPLTQQKHILDIGNVFTIDQNYTQEHSLQITDNTVQFYTDREMIRVEEAE